MPIFFTTPFSVGIPFFFLDLNRKVILFKWWFERSIFFSTDSFLNQVYVLFIYKVHNIIYYAKCRETMMQQVTDNMRVMECEYYMILYNALLFSKRLYFAYNFLRNSFYTVKCFIITLMKILFSTFSVHCTLQYSVST